MKVALWAKRLGGNGHVFLDVVEVPPNSQEWRVPVNQPISAVSNLEIEVTSQSITPVRVFRYQYDPLGRAIDLLPRFLEV